MEQNFGIAVRAEVVAGGLQLAAELLLVVDLTVEHQHHALIAGLHRLMPQGRKVLNG